MGLILTEIIGINNKVSLQISTSWAWKWTVQCIWQRRNWNR